MDAKCQNEDCGHKWSLTKPLHSYSSGPRCPECGTTRVEVDSETPKPGGQPVDQSHPEMSNTAADPPTQQPAQGHQQPAQGRQTVEDAQPPARPETHQQGQQGGALAPEQSKAVGLAAAEVASALNSNDPEERAAAQGQALQAGGAAIAQLGQKYAEQKLEGIRRSKSRGGETLEKAESYATCPECSGQVTELPPKGEEFACPHCRTILVS